MEARVVVVGAGPAGALLAYLLSSRGIETVLVERQSDFSREFRGELLMPSGIRALSAAGLDLEEIAHRVPERIEAFLNGQRFVSVDSSTLAPPHPTAVSQPALLEALVARAQATGHFELRRGATVRGIDDSANQTANQTGGQATRQASARAADGDGGVTLRIRSDGQDGEERLRARFLVGADGRGSICRRSLAPVVRKRSTPLDVVWFKLPYPSDWDEPRARFEIGRGHLTIVVQAADGLLQMAWVILKGSYGELKSRSPEQWIDEMSRYTDPELAHHLRTCRDQISRPFLLNAIADRVVGWSAPGRLLIGDAAHTMSPVGGQGLNLALRDAIVAANELVPALRAGGSLEAAAARVESLRAPEIDLIQRLASLPPRIVMGRTPLHELARQLIARVAGSDLGRSRAGRVASLFLDGVTKVELRV